MADNVNKKLVKLKMSAYKLEKGGYFPPFLFTCICKLGVDTDLDTFNKFMEISERYIHVKGYYFKYPQRLKEDTENIKRELEKGGLL